MRSFRISLLAVLAWAVIGAGVFAEDRSKLVVHEWGTFSTFSGSDGAYLKFYPNDRDLPPFVYSRHRDVKGGLPDVLVSLETPVTYFYSDKDRTASIQVDFPKGMMTDWFPQASRPPIQGLRWDNILIRGQGRTLLPEQSGKGRYFAARETDASQLHITTQGKQENERFLFYRGVGDFTMPFTVRALGNGAFSVTNSGKKEIPGLILVRVEGNKVYFKTSGALSPRSEVRLKESTTASTAERLGDAVANMLVEQGLYEKEARAMVKTWSADWFGQDGVRVLYVVAESLTNELLPIRIEPKPDQLVRVLVGRHDLLTPEKEKEIDALVRRLNGDSNADSRAADRELNKLGRYRWPAQSAAAKRLKLQGASATRR